MQTRQLMLLHTAGLDFTSFCPKCISSRNVLISFSRLCRRLLSTRQLCGRVHSKCGTACQWALIFLWPSG